METDGKQESQPFQALDSRHRTSDTLAQTHRLRGQRLAVPQDGHRRSDERLRWNFMELGDIAKLPKATCNVSTERLLAIKPAQECNSQNAAWKT